MKKNVVTSFLMVSALSLSSGATIFTPKVFAQVAQAGGDSQNTQTGMLVSLQDDAKDFLSEYMKAYNTDTGEAAILDPQTGKVLWDQNGSYTNQSSTQPSPVSTQDPQNSVSDSTDQNARPFIIPTRGDITQGFGPGHPAIDIADVLGTPIWAAGAGVVIKTTTGCADREYRCGGGYGNYVIIDHGKGLQTLYAHLDSLTVNIGDHVTQGQVIGTMGNTGNSRGITGIHLHFEVRLNGVKQLPSNYY